VNKVSDWLVSVDEVKRAIAPIKIREHLRYCYSLIFVCENK